MRLEEDLGVANDEWARLASRSGRIQAPPHAPKAMFLIPISLLK